MQTETLPDAPTLPGLTLIEGIDMDAEVPCRGWNEWSRDCPEGTPADVIAMVRHSGNTYPMCWTCLDHDWTGFWCPQSGEYENRDDHYRILETLR